MPYAMVCDPVVPGPLRTGTVTVPLTLAPALNPSSAVTPEEQVAVTDPVAVGI